MNTDCDKCRGDGWVCEAHPHKPWILGAGCCGEPGVPCECNSTKEHPLDFTAYAASTGVSPLL